MGGKYLSYPSMVDGGTARLGLIPVEWSTGSLRWFIEIASGEALSNTEFDKDPDALRPFSVIGGNGVMGYSAYRNTLKTSIAIGRVGALCGNVHLVKENSWITDNALKISEWCAFHDEFLNYQLASAQLNEIASKTAQPLITGEQVKALRVVIPSLVEQTQIANFLDHETSKIDTLIEKQQRLIGLLKEKRQAVISHAVTKGLNPDVPMKDSGVEWLGDVPGHWDVVTLKHIIRTRKGVAFKADDFCDNGVRVVKASDIKNLGIRTSEIYLPEPFIGKHSKAVLSTGDIVLSTVGSNPDVVNSAVGQLGCVPAEQNGSLLNQNTVVFDSDKNCVLRNYLFFVLQIGGYRDHLDLHAHGTANQSSLNVTDMLDFQIAIPDIDEQRKLCEILVAQCELLRKLEEHVGSSEILLQERRTALISAAVTGKIDVRGWEGADD